MAFKMKGFPYKTGFKHTGGSHEDHHEKTEESKQVSEQEVREKGLASFDVDREYNYVKKNVEGYNKNNPYWTERFAQLQSYMDSKTSDNPQGDISLLKGYQRATP